VIDGNPDKVTDVTFDAKHFVAGARQASFAKRPKRMFFFGAKARDEQTAISIAVEKLAATNRYHQGALVARKAEAMELDDHPEFCE
jgi:hypothetical protein